MSKREGLNRTTLDAKKSEANKQLMKKGALQKMTPKNKGQLERVSKKVKITPFLKRIEEAKEKTLPVK